MGFASSARACSLTLLLLAPLVLAGCSDDTPPPQAFTPLSYSYLRPLRLNVGAVDIDPAPPILISGQDIAPQSPAIPADALRQMAQDRLVAAGSSGRATFTVEQASIVRGDGMLDGLLKVRLDIYTSDGQRAAYAEAAVARTAPVPDDDSALPAALYALTKQMMSDMNVEFEFQLRRTLGDWLQAADGTAPPPPPVQQQSLAPPGTLPPATAPPTPDAYPPGTRFRLVPVAPPPTPPSGGS